ncbi:MAG: 4-oxalomesaconate tautomerase [Gammaproteobacteria bacterium]|nr:4-oxalomesaconate tautomerase [Gammaproteobacteria bacterium]
MQVAISAALMRGGTSKGLYFERADLPAEPGARDRVLLAAMGSPDPRQIDGAGGADPLTSKVAIVGPSPARGVDVDYQFAQVLTEQAVVDVSPSCGNILAGVGPFAIERGMVEAADGETRVRIRMVNTGGVVEAVVQTPGGHVRYDGDVAIDGVPGSGAPVYLNLQQCTGTRTGAMLPTGRPQDEIDGVPVTLIDVAMPMMVVRADSLGRTGYETPAELDADTALLARLERMRRAAGERMGLGDVSGMVIPKVSLVAPPRRGSGVSSRYLVPMRTHRAHAATGAICVAGAAVAPGTVASGVARVHPASNPLVVAVEHPAGRLEVGLDIRRTAHGIEVVSARLVRTARLIFDGRIHVPGRALVSGRAREAPSVDAAA